MKRCVIIAIVSLLSTVAFGQDKYFRKWPEGKSPAEVGRRIAARFVQSAHPNWGNPGPANEITYPETCTWYGALLFAKADQDNLLKKALEGRYRVLRETERKLIPKADHVDHTVFGSIPLELFMQTDSQDYFNEGIRYADEQWELPPNAREEYRRLAEQGLSWQTRLWIDDMFMISAIQAQAFRATGDGKYIDRAAREMVYYLDELQRPNGLFYHAPDVPFFWGRGNGWKAAGMTELLRSLPLDNPDRARILEGYRKMMTTLLMHQDESGMWKQLVDDPEAWNETSATGMFVYAMVMGVRKGWLDEKTFGPAARKAWLALTDYINNAGDISNVCEGTNKKNDRQYYLDRKRNTGDMHGQAPLLWSAFAFLDASSVN